MNQRFLDDVFGIPGPPERPPGVRKRVRESVPIRPAATERIALDVTGPSVDRVRHVRPVGGALDRRNTASATRVMDLIATNGD